jgi:MFS family permease
VGGLASTLFIPLAHLLAGAIGWSHAFTALGGLIALVGGALHYFGLQKLPAHPAQTRRGSGIVESMVSLSHDILDRRFVALTALFTAHTAGFSGLIFLIIPVMLARGATSRDLLVSLAVIGPMQVAGRLLLVTRGRAFSPVNVGLIAMFLLTGSVVSLLLVPPSLTGLLIFAIPFGTGNGVMTIVKGTAIAELFGRERYAELNGALSAPAVIAKAAAPLLLSWIWSLTGEPASALIVVTALMGAGTVSALVLRSLL